MAAVAGSDEEPAAGGRSRLSGRPQQLRQGPEEVALGRSRSEEQPGLRGSEPAILIEIC